MQRTHTANITAGPHTYVADNDDKVQKIIELECRGLEFTEFKPEVSQSVIFLVRDCVAMLRCRRVNGKPKASRVTRRSPAST